MDDWKLPWAGGCRCGQTRIEVTAPPLITMACHCTGCQRMSASAFSLTVVVPEAGFAVTQGEPVIGGLHGEVRHYFCPHCLSWMFTRPPGMDIVNIRPSMLDDHGWYEPFAEVWTSEGLPWATTPAKHSFPTQPGMEEFEPLVAEFAKAGKRPG